MFKHKFKNFFKNDSTICVVYTCLNKLSKFINVHKDKFPSFAHINIVYNPDNTKSKIGT